MKISKLFHWLYASLMFLPLLVAPIFAIYSHRHEINDYSIQVQETIAVNFNQVAETSSISGTDDYSDTGQVIGFNISSYVAPLQHKLLFKCNIDVSSTSVLSGIRVRNPYVSNVVNFTGLSNEINILGISEELYDFTIQLWKSSDVASGDTFSFTDIQVFDLTLMFGAGNEPSLQQFNTWYDEDYYHYTLSHRELLKTGNFITYDDTDIGSQFLYDLYNTTDKYLNFDSVLNLYQVNDWINLNVFNGSVPLVWYIIWHYLDYWLLLSIFWLCFDVLIYVPQLAHRWLDKASLE